MAQKVQILLEDDIDGTAADETITFGLDGKSYEIDLNDKNATKMRTALQKYVNAGRVQRGGVNGGKRSGAKLTPVGPSAREVRDWARTNGYTIPARGRIPQDVRELFDAAH